MNCNKEKTLTDDDFPFDDWLQGISLRDQVIQKSLVGARF